MYAKLFASLYQGTLRGCPDEILVFTNLLAHADINGVVDKHWRAISEETGLPRDRVEAAILVLEAPDPESRSPEHEGRRLVRVDEHRAWGWLIVNHGKYRAIRNEEDRREQNRKAQERWRNKQNKPRKPEKAHTEADTEADTEAEAGKKKKTAPEGVSSQDLKFLKSKIEITPAALDWLRVRKAHRAALTEAAWAGMEREAGKAGIDVSRAVEICAEKSWRGFDASWSWNGSHGAKAAAVDKTTELNRLMGINHGVIIDV